MIAVLLVASATLNVALFLRLRVVSSMKRSEDRVVDYLIARGAQEPSHDL